MSLFKKERLPASVADETGVAPHSVMVVDDEDGNLRVLTWMLSERYRVLVARDGREALDLLQAMAPADAPSVILSDQRMPRMSGVELFEQVRELFPASIRIILTGFVEVDGVIDAVNRAGVYKFLVKPCDRHELLLTVERAIEAFEMRQQLDRHVCQLESAVLARTRELEHRDQALQEAYTELERASLSDPLTGLGNRRQLAQRLDRPGRDGTRNGNGALLLVDIDQFKAINDRHGHAAGDAVLSAIGRILLQHCRTGDLAVRWGGDEFLLWLALDEPRQALQCADRLRQAVAEQAFEIGIEAPLSCSCSIGVACLPFDVEQPERIGWQRTLSIADLALYLAKRAGRNAAICLAAGGPLPPDFEQRLAQSPQQLIDDGTLQVGRDG